MKTKPSTAQQTLYIGANIRRGRTHRDLSQEELAERVGITPQYLSLLENGSRCGSIATYLSIANAFGIHLSDLFGSQKEDTARFAEELSILELLCDSSPFELRVLCAIIVAAKNALRS